MKRTLWGVPALVVACALGAASARAGIVVQDFVGLASNSYGGYADKNGSSLALDMEKKAPHWAKPAARFTYDLMGNGGWCGTWIRVGGADWKGEDWSRAKGLRLEVYSKDDVGLQLSFNDVNQNAYVSDTYPVEHGAWRTVDVPMNSFALNQYYQPAKAKKGAPLDLGKMTTFGIAPVTPGKHTFWVRMVRLLP